jgi:TonB family protein
MSAWFNLLLSAALKSTVVVSAAWLLAFTLRRHSAAARHLVWTAAVAALLALPLLSVSMPALRVRTGALKTMVPSIVFRTTAVATANAGAPSDPQTAREQQPTSGRAPWSPDLGFLIPLLWAAGTTLALAHMLAAWTVMWRVRRTARTAGDSPLFRTLTKALGIRTHVDLLEIPSGSMPVSFGILRPAVFLPADARDWSEDRRRVVMLHELAHVWRFDLATQMVARAAVALFWWNPLAWTAWREFVKERERAADDLVLTAGEPAIAYASHLLDIARSMQHVPALVSAAVAMARPSQLEGRLTAILDARTNRTSPGPRAALAAGVMAVALVAPFAALQAQDKPDVAIQPAVEATIRTAVEQQNHEVLDAAAAAYVTSHKYDAAQQLLENSLTIRAKTSGDHSSAYAIGLMKLGDLSAKRGKVTDAVDFYTRAVALGDTPETAPGLIYLATNSLAEKDPIAGEGWIDRALNVATKGAMAGRALTVKGNIALANGLTGVAELNYLQALAQDPPESTEAALTMETYAKFLTEESRSGEAQALQQQALAIRQAHVAAISPKLTTSGDIAKVGGGVSAPTLLHKQEPEYSEDARLTKYQGTVVLAVTIGPDGQAANLELTKSIGFGLDEKAAEAVTAWKFKPGMRDGQPVAVHAAIEVNFRLL